ncbi:MAG: hypothetical protein P8R42_16170 [Candidatus Binatia bacterium]|nr:hypothetical protein [Candidatus Binatia bacterium]
MSAVGGTNAHCGAVAALFSDSFLGETFPGLGTQGVGCFFEPIVASDARRLVAPTTTASAVWADRPRYCACQ